MSDLKSQLIKLGSTNPELRPHIRKILKVAGKYSGIERQINKVRSDISTALRKADAEEVMQLNFADSLLGDAADAIRFL